MNCKKCGTKKNTVTIPCPDGIQGCLVIHSKQVCPKCIKTYKVNIKPDATLAELIVFLNRILRVSECHYTSIPKGLERHFDEVES